MSDEVLVKVENVSKKFCQSLKRSMIYGLEDIARDVFHLPNISDRVREDEFWAVDNVSFEIKRGECLGIIGRNGAGKSTLLKMLNGIFLPDKGKISIKGKVASLIEVGAGFHPMLTGRENIYINGSILGMSRKEIDRQFDEIVEFAELGDFINMPVKHYSSGMYVRLGFAIAAHLEPDVLILDEILAVGDASFRAKSFNHISKIIKKSAVVFVSHNMPNIARISTKTMLMERGTCRYFGEKVNQGVSEYLKMAVSDIESNHYSYDGTRIDEIQMNGYKGPNIHIRQTEPILLGFKAYFKEKYESPQIMAVVSNQEYLNIVQITSPPGVLKIKNNVVTVEVDLNHLVLNPGNYTMTVAVLDKPNGKILARYHNCCRFYVSGETIGFASVLQEGNWRIL